jgi:hypothetical protein
MPTQTTTTHNGAEMASSTLVDEKVLFQIWFVPAGDDLLSQMSLPQAAVRKRNERLLLDSHGRPKDIFLPVYGAPDPKNTPMECLTGSLAILMRESKPQVEHHILIARIK